VKKTFIDSGVLITAARGDEANPKTLRAWNILDDESRYFFSTIYVQMEVIPKAMYHKNQDEVDFYNGYFANVHEWINCDDNLLQLAFQIASDYGLSCIDALHITAASLAGIDEFITTEKNTKSIHRATFINIISIS
jgi:predicted nucleic acid-binding protein